MVIGIDFDGTCVAHRFPAVGPDVPGAVRVLKRLALAGHKLMLWTMRDDERSDKVLTPAVLWFEHNEIPLWGVNVNHDQRKSRWSMSPKQYAALYIDDAAAGCPLMNLEGEDRPVVDWDKMEKILDDLGCFPKPVQEEERSN